MAIFENSIDVSPIINNVREQKSCNFCGNYFDNEKDLNAHTLSVHVMPLDLSPPIRKTLFFCESCDVNFSEAESLKNHMKLHEIFGIKVTTSKPEENEIEQDKNQFKSISPDSKMENFENNLSSNIINNKNEKIVSCDICHKFSGTLATLQMHLKIVHEGQKPKNGFTKNENKKDNFGWDTIQTCDICKKFSGTSSTLEIHMNIVHKGQKIFQSMKNDQSPHFDNNYEFSTEQFIQMAILGNECVFCNMKIPSKKLQEHMESTHKNQTEKPHSEDANQRNNFYTTKKEFLYSIFTAKQVWYLEKIFSVKKNINNSEMEKLSQLGNFPVDKIKQWFEKRSHIENSDTAMDKSTSNLDIGSNHLLI